MLNLYREGESILHLIEFIKKKIVIVITIIFLTCICIISNLLYCRDFTIVVVNNTESVVDSIRFKTSGNETEDIIISSIMPNSKVRISKRFLQKGETLLATVKNAQSADFTFPLNYLYTLRDRVVIKLYINSVEDGKIQQLTRKTFCTFNARNNLEFLIPWWIRVYYNYNTDTIDVT